MKSGLKKCVERSGENEPPGSEGCIKPVIGRDDVRRRLSLKRNGIRREGLRNRVLKGERQEYWDWKKYWDKGG